MNTANLEAFSRKENMQMHHLRHILNLKVLALLLLLAMSLQVVEIHIQTCTALRLLSGPTLNQSLPVLCKVVIQMSFSNQHPMAHKDISMSYAWKRYQGMEYGRYTSIPGGGMTTINYHCPIRMN